MELNNERGLFLRNVKYLIPTAQSGQFNKLGNERIRENLVLVTYLQVFKNGIK